jgi:hypothetical protein
LHIKNCLFRDAGPGKDLAGFDCIEKEEPRESRGAESIKIKIKKTHKNGKLVKRQWLRSSKGKLAGNPPPGHCSSLPFELVQKDGGPGFDNDRRDDRPVSECKANCTRTSRNTPAKCA